MRVLGVVIAGGQSRRMGGDEKALRLLAGVPLIERVISRIAFQVEAVAINANGNPMRFNRFGHEVIADEIDTGTPLAGLHAAVAQGAAEGFDAVLTVPSDTPFLPLDLVARLAEAGQLTGAAVASSGGQTHHLTGLWSTAMAGKLEEVILDHKLQRVMDLGGVFDVAVADWPVGLHDPFLNINTPEELSAAEAVLHG
jgi:molybdenum cofactor guanylyltransferase